MTAVDYQVSAGADDGNWYSDGDFYSTDTEAFVGFITPPDVTVNTFARWSGVTLPSGATITNAYVSVYRSSTMRTPLARLYFNDAAAAVAPTSYSQAYAKVKTTAYITWNPPTSGTWVNSGDCKTIIQELVDSYDYSSGSAMMMLWTGLTPVWSVDSYDGVRSYEHTDHTFGAKLHIEYTDPAPMYGGRSRSGFFKF